MDALAGLQLVIESWAKLWPDAREMMLEHRVETGQDDPRAPLAPDHARIEALEASGGLICASARWGSRLVGYSIWYLVPSLESEGLLMAMQAPWYVRPSYRSSGAGLRLWRFALAELTSRGCVALFLHAPMAGDGEGLGKFFARQGALQIGTEWMLWLRAS